MPSWLLSAERTGLSYVAERRRTLREHHAELASGPRGRAYPEHFVRHRCSDSAPLLGGVPLTFEKKPSDEFIPRAFMLAVLAQLIVAATVSGFLAWVTIVVLHHVGVF